MVKINLKINCICFFSDFVITTPLQQSTMWSIPKMYGLNSKLSDNGKLETRSSNNVLSAMPINLALLLLHKQLSNISGLEDTELCLQKRFTVQKGKFLQNFTETSQIFSLAPSALAYSDLYCVGRRAQKHAFVSAWFRWG